MSDRLPLPDRSPPLSRKETLERAAAVGLLSPDDWRELEALRAKVGGRSSAVN